MTTLNQIIQREVNPFDSVTFTTGNFWTEEKQLPNATVESIHQSAITQIQNILQQVIRDSRTRSVLLMGDSGCGKSYLLSRLKKTLNDRAFFVYIDPCPSSDYVWQHTLRYTVDGLMHVPEGEQESQLLLWLKGLSAYRDGGIKKRILGAKNNFIHELRSIYPTSIYQPNDFFAVLYALADPKLYFSACDWLRGNNISEEELKLLGVGSVIDSEQAAKGIVANFGRIATDNKPIVLCFDQVELSGKLPDGSLDISSIFKINTAFHNDNLKNFVVIVSIVRDIWMNYQKTIPLSDLARISNQKIILKQINLEQVKALWETRLYPIHAQVNPQPISSIAPLKKKYLEDKYPGEKANLRGSLNFGGMIYEKYKSTGSSTTSGASAVEVPKSDNFTAFKLLWQDEFNKTKVRITRLRQLSSPELIEMLMSAMRVLGVKDLRPKLLSGKYSAYSFSYSSGDRSQCGVLWNEDPNMRSFSYAMKACKNKIESNQNIQLILIRSESMGNEKNRGYQTYQQIFSNSPHKHFESSLESVHYLKTYQKLVNQARSGDLVLNFKPLRLTDLEKLVQKTKILEQCDLLQDLKVVSNPSKKKPKPINIISPPIRKIFTAEKEFLLNLVEHHHLLGKEILVKQATSQFANTSEAQIKELIQQLIQEQKISIVNPKKKSSEQLICLIPQAPAKV